MLRHGGDAAMQQFARRIPLLPPSPYLSLCCPSTLLVNLQLKAKHVLAASKCLSGAHPRCLRRFDNRRCSDAHASMPRWVCVCE